MALTKINEIEIMTKHEAKQKYCSKYITMARTKLVDEGDNDLGYVGYVVYVYDKYKEKLNIPRDEINSLRSKNIVLISTLGYNVDEGIQPLFYRELWSFAID